jgi:hypothetical protein
LEDRILTIGRLAQTRAPGGLFAPSSVDSLLDEVGLPRPRKTSDALLKLEKRGALTRVKGVRGAAWKLTPEGRALAEAIATDMDLAALVAEAAQPSATVLGATAHPVVPPSLAPPALIGPLHAFLSEYPFERNVFGMTRFPGKPTNGELDPIEPALEQAEAVCKRHGLVFHLASDRSIVDDLWANVAAHMWACRYGIAFFEARTERGLNYNLNIEVGSCLVLGRRLALLKDHSLKAMPTDLVGHIYKSVDLDDPSSVEKALDAWIQDDLRIR